MQNARRHLVMCTTGVRAIERLSIAKADGVIISLPTVSWWDRLQAGNVRRATRQFYTASSVTRVAIAGTTNTAIGTSATINEARGAGAETMVNALRASAIGHVAPKTGTRKSAIITFSKGNVVLVGKGVITVGASPEPLVICVRTLRYLHESVAIHRMSRHNSLLVPSVQFPSHGVSCVKQQEHTLVQVKLVDNKLHSFLFVQH